VKPAFFIGALNFGFVQVSYRQQEISSFPQVYSGWRRYHDRDVRHELRIDKPLRDNIRLQHHFSTANARTIETNLIRAPHAN